VENGFPQQSQETVTIDGLGMTHPSFRWRSYHTSSE
jgi:hypothetical protein